MIAYFIFVWAFLIFSVSSSSISMETRDDEEVPSSTPSSVRVSVAAAVGVGSFPALKLMASSLLLLCS